MAIFDPAVVVSDVFCKALHAVKRRHRTAQVKLQHMKEILARKHSR